MIRIVIADDQSIIREGIKLILEQDADIEVVGSAINGIEAFEMCRKYLPDMVLMDMGMPVCGGVEGIKLIKEKFKNIKVVIFANHKEEMKISEALHMGVDGYVFKDMKCDQLILTIKSISKGLKVMHEEVYDFILKQLVTNKDTQSIKAGIEELSLTEREIELIKLIVCGKSYKEVSTALYLSEGSVRNAISVILSKLNLRDRIQLAVFAVRRNIA